MYCAGATSAGDSAAAARRKALDGDLQAAFDAVTAAGSSRPRTRGLRAGPIGIGTSPVLDGPPGGKSSYGLLAASATTFEVSSDHRN